MDKYFIDGLVAAVHPDTHFYNCNGCGWSGDELVYADADGRGQPFGSQPNHRSYKPYQGHCPRCGRPFVGTRLEAKIILDRAEERLEAFNVSHPIVAMGSGEWDEHTALLNAVEDARRALEARDDSIG